jgi:Ca2+-binding EF-hand superfamily protein
MELSEAQIDDMFLKVDTDESGEIDYSEFVVAAMS